ncbi:MAG: hypothetical protein HUU21_36950, partial [Polyangiaceae bacterium]|nr:hypothetical protein [Polyangiaceae bacterium]
APVPAPVRVEITKVPAPEPTSAEPAEPPPTDHERVVRRVGLGFLGISDLPIAVAEPTGTEDSAGLSPNDRVIVDVVSAPTLGARFWLTRRFGIDAGLGFSYRGGSTSSELGSSTADVTKQSVLGFLVHAGAPIMITELSHMALLVIPGVTFGMASSDVEPLFEENAPPPAELRGYRLDVGVRAGAEIHFGFMGLPNLALEAGIGLIFTSEWASATVGDQSVVDHSMRLTTTSFSDPWDIFRGVGSVSARYYF